MPFDPLNEHIQAGINIQVSSSILLNFVSVILKPYKLTFQQYNVLRILRDGTPNPVSVKEISSKMIDRNSNASRLVDKLVEKKLALRNASPVDKRITHISVTEKGVDLVNAATLELEAKFLERMSLISKDEIKTLNALLEKLTN